MTVRIEVKKSDSGHVIHVDGWLEGVDEATELLSVARQASGSVVLDLENLRSADACGLSALYTLSVEGARLHRSSDYIKLLMESVKGTDSAPN